MRLLDAYGNLATSDSSISVTLTLGANPAGGTLGGTTTQTVSGGVATFTNLSIDTAGSGYTLVGQFRHNDARRFRRVSTSSRPPPRLVEDFEGNRSYYVVGGRFPTASISTARQARRQVRPDRPSGQRLDLPQRRGRPGQAGRYDLRLAAVLRRRPTAGPTSVSAPARGGTLSLVAAPNTNQLLFQDNTGYGFTDIAAVSQTWQANHWYRLEVDWGTSGTIVGKVFDSNGATLLKPSSATDDGDHLRRHRLPGDRQFNKYWDTVTVTPSVNNFAAPAAASSTPAAANRTDVARMAAAYWESWNSLFGPDSPWPAPTSQRNDGQLANAVFGQAANAFFRFL